MLPDELNHLLLKADKVLNLYNAEQEQFSSSLNILSNWIAQRAWFLTGDFWHLVGETEKAKIHYKALEHITPILNKTSNQMSFDLSDLYFNLGIIHFEDEDYENSLCSFNRVINITKSSPESWFNVGYIYNITGNTEQAISSYEEAVILHPKYIKAWVNLSISYSKENYFDKAFQAYEEALKIDPKCKKALININNFANSFF